MAIVSTVVNCGVAYFTSNNYYAVFSTIFGLTVYMFLFIQNSKLFIYSM